MTIENEYSFKEALGSGINILTGAGFSLLAEDESGRALPAGNALKAELEAEFGVKGSSLEALATILKYREPDTFRDFLTRRFSVGKFDPLYFNLNRVNIHCCFTTNIDNLFPKIAARNPMRFIRNIKDEGDVDDDRAICYLPIHGNVEDPQSDYIFSITEVAAIFDNAPRIMGYLSGKIEKRPTLFLGYGFHDNAVIQSVLSGRHTNLRSRQPKWILLNDPSQEGLDLFHAMGFNVINGDIREFLETLPRLVTSDAAVVKGKTEVSELFKENVVPASNKGLTQRSILYFYRGMEPTWADILSGNIVDTEHVGVIKNAILDKGKHTIVVGAPLCGKSTAAMKALSSVPGGPLKLMFPSLTMTRAEYLAKFLINSGAIVMVENIADDIDAFNRQAEVPGIKLLGVARSMEFGIVSHLVNTRKFNIVNVTEISGSDLNRVYQAIPKNSRSNKIHLSQDNPRYKKDTIFEFVLKNIKGQSIEERFRSLLLSCDETQVKFLSLCAYMHTCRVPLSIEMAASFFSGSHSYSEMPRLISELDDILNELDVEGYDDMEYYYPRSSYLSDVIMKNSPKDILREVYWGVLRNVPQVQIPSYNIFRRKAFDHRLMVHVFDNWEEGRDFYEQAYRFDYNNVYILQQEALYLANKRKYDLAFSLIDRAKMLTSDRQFSIRNTHAIILFEANYDKSPSDAVDQLRESMEILKKCYKDDKRKAYHASVFAEQAQRFLKKVQNEQTKEYLNLAERWLDEEINKEPWNRDCQRRLSSIREFKARFKSIG